MRQVAPSVPTPSQIIGYIFSMPAVDCRRPTTSPSPAVPSSGSSPVAEIPAGSCGRMRTFRSTRRRTSSWPPVMDVGFESQGQPDVDVRKKHRLLPVVPRHARRSTENFPVDRTGPSATVLSDVNQPPPLLVQRDTRQTPSRLPATADRPPEPRHHYALDLGFPWHHSPTIRVSAVDAPGERQAGPLNQLVSGRSAFSLQSFQRPPAVSDRTSR